MKNTKMPAIRFKGFNDDWEQRKLEDFGKATGGTSIESEFSEDGVYKVISIGSYSENSVYNDQGIRAIKSDKTSNRVLNLNDLTMILNDKTTSGNIIGRVLLIEESGIYVYNQRTERIEINLDEYDPVFLYEMLNAPNIREKIIKQAQGNTQIYVNWTTISLLEYMIPSKEEQVKIGELLHGISNLIALHQRKLEKIKIMKKSMLEKMFPRDAESIPKIRFDGYTDDWEQRKVLDLLIQPITDGPHETPKLVEEGVPFISVDAIVDNKIDFNRKRGNISEKYDELCCKKYKPQFHDVYLVKSGSTVGKVAIVETTDRFNIWSPLAAMRCGEKTYPYFLYDLLQTKDLQAQVADKASNGTQPNLSMRELEKFPVSVPSNLEEQKKIGDYFRNLDHLIALHQRKLEKLKKVKKSLLEHMFPMEK